jgi:hypothetical protein
VDGVNEFKRGPVSAPSESSEGDVFGRTIRPAEKIAAIEDVLQSRRRPQYRAKALAINAVARAKHEQIGFS